MIKRMCVRKLSTGDSDGREYKRRAYSESERRKVRQISRTVLRAILRVTQRESDEFGRRRGRKI